MKRNKVLIAAIVLTVLIAGGTAASKTYATYTSKDTVTNNFTTGSIEIENDETKDDKGTPFSKVDQWDPTKPENKIVKVHNKGKSPALIRVAITPRWVNDDGTPFAGDTSIVNIAFSNHVKNSFSDEKDYWIKNNNTDGYYYYSSVVNPGKDTNVLIESVSATIPESLQSRYKGKKLIVDVRSEAVLASVIDSTVKPKTGVYTKAWGEKTGDLKTLLDRLSGVNS